MSNRKFRLLAGLALVAVMVVVYMVLMNNEDSNKPAQQNDGVVIK